MDYNIGGVSEKCVRVCVRVCVLVHVCTTPYLFTGYIFFLLDLML